MTSPEPTPDTATLIAAAKDAIGSLRYAFATNGRDWSTLPDDAWFYGIVCGWGPDDPEDGDALPELAARHRWTPERVDRLRALHHGWSQIPALLAALAAAEQQTADANIERWRMKEKLDRSTAQSEKELVEAADDAVRWANERDAARAEVAELTQQRDQAVAGTLPWMVQHDGDWYLNQGHPAIKKLRSILAIDGDADYVADVLARWGDALAAPVPAGDTSHDDANLLHALDRARHAIETQPYEPRLTFMTPEAYEAAKTDPAWVGPAPVVAHAGQDETPCAEYAPTAGGRPGTRFMCKLPNGHNGDHDCGVKTWHQEADLLTWGTADEVRAYEQQRAAPVADNPKET